MSLKIINVKQSDKYNTKVYAHLCEDRPVASVLIIHGMAEYSGRYERFINFLNEHSIDCYIYDQRGHGKDMTVSQLGHSPSKSGYNIFIKDALTVASRIRKIKRSESFVLFGHSFGSLVARNVACADNGFSAVIISSTQYNPPLTAAVMCAFSRLLCLIKGRHNIAYDVNNMIFGTKDYVSFEGRTAFDWISSDHVEVSRYMNDPYCGYVCDYGFYHDLSVVSRKANSRKVIAKGDKNMKILFIGGEKDPVGSFGKAHKKIKGIYKRLGYANARFKLYPDCRHELLNEKNRDAVMKDILDYIVKA